MATLQPGQSVTLQVTEGESWTVTPTGQAQISTRGVSGGPLQAPTTIATATTFGPYTESGTLTIFAMTGSATYTGSELASLVSGDGNISDATTLLAALERSATATRPMYFTATPGSTIVLPASGITINTATTSIDFRGARLDASAVTGNNRAITLTYEPSDFSAGRKYGQSSMVIERFVLVGPGRNLAANIDAGNGTHGIYTQGRIEPVLGNRAVRPTLKNFRIEGFDHGYTCGDVSFLGQIDNPTIYECRVGWRQLAATDSGENYRIIGGITQRCDLSWLLEDGSSEWFVYAHSVDYGIQLAVLRPTGSGGPGTSWARLGFTDCHIETRGKQLGSDPGYYVSQGTGQDTRVPITLRDSFIDVDGTGSLVYFHGGLLDLNDSGGAGPWNFTKLINARHKNSGVRGYNCSVQSLQNVNNLLATGAGYVKFEGGQLMFPSALTLPARISDNPVCNRLFDGAFPTANIRDLWTIRRDTAEITNRWTGTNGSMARDNSVTRAITINYALTMSGVGVGTQTITADGSLPAFSPMMVGRNFVVGSGVASITSVDSESQITVNVSVAFASTAIASGAAVARSTASLRVTKVGASGTNFEAACLIPCKPGERLVVHGYHWIKSSGGLTGTPAVNTRWAKRGMDKVAALAGARSASATIDPASVASGASTATQTITVTGAALGDAVTASFSLDLQGLSISAWVSAADTVSYRFNNLTGGAVDLGSGTLRVTTLSAGAGGYLQTIPTEGYADTAGTDWDLGAARDAAVIRTVDLAVTPTNTWIEFVLTVPNESASAGAMQCPEWADCLEFVVNLNAANAGDINFTDLTVSAY